MPFTDSSLRWLVLSTPKRGHTQEECEDAWAADPATGRFAVADGASESAFAALWAQLLAEGFIAAPRPRQLPLWLEASRHRWSGKVLGMDLPWYAEMKRAQGAFATLLGVSVRPPTPEQPGKWRAVAVGDSCLIRVREGGDLRSFPIRETAGFGNRPTLIGSRDGPIPASQRDSGSLRPGDRVLLMTDALAKWFLRSHESGGRPWEALASLSLAGQPEAAFAAWVEERRTHDGLANDDVTLLIVQPGAAEKE
jgi:hypothetical protein